MCAPQAFLGVIPICAAVSLLALMTVSYLPWVATALSTSASLVIICELLLYREIADPWFPQKEGTNIIGTITPTHEVKRRVILSAHQDSAWEYNLWYWFKTAGVIVNIIGLIGMLAPAVVGTLLGLELLPAISPAVSWVCYALVPFIALHLLFHTGNAVPGAMDDLAGVAVVTQLGRTLAKEHLRNTEVLILACAAEECGLRGAKRFVGKYSWVFHQIPTFDINIDGVYDEQYLTAITRELTTNTRHDLPLIELAATVATKGGWTMKRAVIPFGGTDAAAFANAGIRSTTLLCQDTRKLAPNYHTRLDTLDKVRPEALTAMHDVVAGLVREIDTGILDETQRQE